MTIGTVLSWLMTNAVLCVPLSAGAWLVWRCTRHAALARVALLVVAVKMLTPPVATIHVPVRWSAAVSSTASVPSEGTFLLVAPTGAGARGRAAPGVLAGARAGVVVWAVGSCVVLVLVVRGVVRLNRLVRRASAADERTLWLAEEARASLRLRRLPVIKVVDAELSPLVVAGLWRSRHTVVLPARLVREMSDAQLRTVLAHELCHLRRRDHWWRWVETGAMVLYWWHPCLWWTRAMLRRTEELCCDGQVAATFSECAAEYARALVEAATFVRAAPVVDGAVRFMSETRSLERRISMIQRRRGFRLSGVARVAAVAGAAAALPVSVALACEPPEGFPTIDEIMNAVQAGGAGVRVQGFAIGPGGAQPVPMQLSNDQLRTLVGVALTGNGMHTADDGTLLATQLMTLGRAFTLDGDGRLERLDATRVPAGGVSGLRIDLNDMLGEELDQMGLGDMNLGDLDLDGMMSDAIDQIDFSQVPVAAAGGVCGLQGLPAGCSVYTVGPDGSLVHLSGSQADAATLGQLMGTVGNLDLNGLIRRLTGGSSGNGGSGQGSEH